MPIVVVSDSSPIRALHHLDLLFLCRELYGSVIVPEAVVELRFFISPALRQRLAELAGE